jgi:hypothetical protein
VDAVQYETPWRRNNPIYSMTTLVLCFNLLLSSKKRFATLFLSLVVSASHQAVYRWQPLGIERRCGPNNGPSHGQSRLKFGPARRCGLVDYKAASSGMQMGTFLAHYEHSRHAQVGLTVAGIHSIQQMFSGQSAASMHWNTLGIFLLQNVGPAHRALVQAACRCGVGSGTVTNERTGRLYLQLR